MSIVSTTVHEVASGPSQRLLYYRCTDHLGALHDYGPVITSNPAFDADAHRTVVAVKVAEALAAREAAQLLE